MTKNCWQLYCRKPLTIGTSYQVTSLLLVISRLFQKLLLRSWENLNYLFKTDTFYHHTSLGSEVNVLPSIRYIKALMSMESKEILCGIFQDVLQVLDSVWLHGLEYKLEQDLPQEILKSYTVLSDRHLRVRYENEYYELRKILLRYLKVSAEPPLYLLYRYNGTTCAEIQQ